MKAHRLEYHSTLGWRVIKKKKKPTLGRRRVWVLVELLLELDGELLAVDVLLAPQLFLVLVHRPVPRRAPI